MNIEDLLTLVNCVKEMKEEDKPITYQQIGKEAVDRGFFDMLSDLDEYIKEESDHSWIERQNYNSRLRNLLSHYKTHESTAKADLLNARIDFTVILRAIAMILDSVMNAGTHNEKNSRLRGAITIIEQKIDDLRAEHLEQLQSRGFIGHDYHSSLYPVRSFIGKIRGLESENTELKKEIEKIKERFAPDPPKPSDESPF